MDMFLVTADDDANGTWCSICKTDVINGRHPNHGAHIENAKAKAADDERDRLTTPTARKVTAEGMDTYLTVSSNDTLTHQALRGAPDTLCGKVITDDKSPSKDLDCDICAALSGGNSFVNESVNPLADEFGHHTANYLLPPEAYMEDEVEVEEEGDWAREANLRPNLDFEFGPEPARRLEEGPIVVESDRDTSHDINGPFGTLEREPNDNCVYCGMPKEKHEKDGEAYDLVGTHNFTRESKIDAPAEGMVGILYGDDGDRYRTDDGGETWNKLAIDNKGWGTSDQCRSCHRKFDDRQLRYGLCSECEQDNSVTLYNQDSREERTKEIDNLRSAAKPAVQQEKIATNWTRDGVPIENGFEIITTTEAERIPFLDVDRVTISAKHVCPDCHTEQWIQTTAACDSCGEMKCTNCMDTIGLASFVGKCKKCSSISTEIVPESAYDSDSYRYLSYTLNTEVEESLFLPSED